MSTQLCREKIRTIVRRGSRDSRSTPRHHNGVLIM
jgi:hypothetical protein